MDNIEIITERLLLRRFTEDDLGDLTAFVRDKMASEYAPYDTQWPTDDGNMKNILGYFMSDPAWFAVELTEEGRVIGFVCANHITEVPNLGYTIRSDYHSSGYAYEACRALMEYCRSTYGTKKFVSGTADCNEPSVRLLEKLGFKKTRSVQESFARDADGNPIVFTGGAYECRCD